MQWQKAMFSVVFNKKRGTKTCIIKTQAISIYYWFFSVFFSFISIFLGQLDFFKSVSWSPPIQVPQICPCHPNSDSNTSKMTLYRKSSRVANESRPHRFSPAQMAPNAGQNRYSFGFFFVTCDAAEKHHR